MKKKFEELLQIKDIDGAILFSNEGKVMFETHNKTRSLAPEIYQTLFELALTCQHSHEVDVVFEKSRIYLRKAAIGYLMILMKTGAPIAMVRLSADMLMPELTAVKQAKGFGRFFKRKG